MKDPINYVIKTSASFFVESSLDHLEKDGYLLYIHPGHGGEKVRN